MSTLGDRIRARRFELNYTLREAATRAGCTASTWRKWETGEIKSMKTDKLDRIAQALHTTRDALLGNDLASNPDANSLDTIGDRIYARRKALDFTLQELADKTGVPLSTIRNWESGYTDTIKHTKIKEIAAALDVTPAYLLGWEDDILAYKNVRTLPKTRTVPIIGEIACGQPILAEDNYDGEANIDRSIDADFALRCRGDSMINARIFNGDLVFIKQQPDVENGEIAAVLIDGEATLKRVYKYAMRVELRPENPTFPVLNYEGPALQEVKILGKAVAFLSMVR